MATSVNIEWHGDAMIRKIEKAADVALNATTQYAAEQASQSMMNSIAVPNGTAVKRQPSSAPGTPPAAKNGGAGLAGSIVNTRVGKLKWAFGTNLDYARIHELGGTINHPGGTAYKIVGPGKAAFVSNANATANMKRTKPHPIVMPARPFLRPVINTKKKQMQGVFNHKFKEIFGGGS